MLSKLLDSCCTHYRRTGVLTFRAYGYSMRTTVILYSVTFELQVLKSATDCSKVPYHDSARQVNSSNLTIIRERPRSFEVLLAWHLWRWLYTMNGLTVAKKLNKTLQRWLWQVIEPKYFDSNLHIPHPLYVYPAHKQSCKRSLTLLLAQRAHHAVMIQIDSCVQTYSAQNALQVLTTADILPFTSLKKLKLAVRLARLKNVKIVYKRDKIATSV